MACRRASYKHCRFKNGKKEKLMTKIHDNDFDLGMVGLTKFSFVVSEHSITSGQPWDGVTSRLDKTGTGATITVKAGRKKSKNTAAWFANQIRGGSAIGCQTIDKLPHELNFACKGKMTFTHGGKDYEGVDVVIAQGSTGFSRNNWWLGGPKMTTVVDLPIGILSIVEQTFTTRVLPAKVLFTVAAGDVLSMSMGIAKVS
jgi:hypothetical protein